MFSIPNGGFIVEARTVSKLKWQGLYPGWPDLGVAWAPGMIGWIECKSEGGRVSPDQKAVHAALRAMGHSVAVCRSAADAAETMDEWGVPVGRAAADGHG